MTIPNKWGQGAVFAFSAWDGEAHFSHGLVGSLCGDRVGVRFHLKTPRELAFCIPQGTGFSMEAVTGDVILLSLGEAKGGFAFLDSESLVGRSPAPSFATVFAEGLCHEEAVENGFVQEADGEWLALLRQGDAFALSYGETRQTALEHCRRALNADFDALVKARLSFFEKSPVSDCHPHALLASKCLSVMKTQLYSPEGRFRRIWSTPNRYPHKRLWLWDSVFHAVGYRHVAPAVAEDLILAVLDTQREDGFIPHMSTPEKSSRFIQPPVLAWGAWQVYEKGKNTAFLKQIYLANRRFLKWCDENRRIEGSLLYTWETQGNERCRCDECGMDNSPRFDPVTQLYAIDFSCFVANEMRFMAKLAKVLGEPSSEWEEAYAVLSRAINEALWDEEDGFYYDRDHSNGKLLKVRAVSSFLPLFAGICSAKQAHCLVSALTDPEDFGTAMPVPSLSKKDPVYGSDMWRGPVWINYNYMIVSGLLEYGFDALADEIREKTLAELERHYLLSGTVYEFYDPEGICAPHRQNRKGTPSPFYGLGSPMQPVRDFGWSCTLALDLICQG